MSTYVKTRADVNALQAAQRFAESVRTTMAPFSINLTDSEKQGFRVMAEGREGYVRLVSQIASAHDTCLAKMDNANDLVVALKYDEDLESLRQSLLSAMEIVINTQMANAKDIMQLADRYVHTLQAARSGNDALNTAMKEVDEWNKRHSGTPKAEVVKPEASTAL